MQYGIQVGNTSSWDTLKRVAQVVDRGSWNSLWNFDHLMPPLAKVMPHVAESAGGTDAYEAGACHEAWAILAGWAAITERVRLGCLVTATTFRNPALLAKIAVTTDHISNGRLELGIGAAWHEREHDAYGFALGSVKERLDRLGEAVQIIRNLFDTTGPHTFEGTYNSLHDAPFAPPAVQRRIPLMIGGGGEKRTLRLVAQYADTANFMGNFMASRADALRKNEILDEHCLTVGRDPRDIRRTLTLIAILEPDDKAAAGLRESMGQHLSSELRDQLPIGGRQRLLDHIGPYLTAGFSEIIFMDHAVQPEALEAFDREILCALESPAVR